MKINQIGPWSQGFLPPPTGAIELVIKILTNVLAISTEMSNSVPTS